MAGQPTKIGKYDIIREIGRGGMGKVYGAIDPTIGRMVAIKQVTAVVSDDPDLLKRFYREAQSTGKLQHPNIVTLHDLGEQDGIPYLVMEYLEGESLEKIIQERQPHTVAEKLHIIIQVCEGLAYAHQRQIIHRDIKPGNVVVLHDGGVKIVDFGIAQFGNERYTRTGQVIGSLYYMSPEQIQDGDIDSRSDIYSTGIVLYEFLSGTVPFRGKDQTSTLAKILRDPPPSLANSVDVYATELDAVVGRALSKDRNTRYTSMEDFAFDLRSLEEKLRRDLIEGYMRSAETLIGGKQWDKARDQLRQILKLDKQHRHANELLREVQTQIQRQQVSEQVRVLKQRADEALGLRNWDEALAALDQAIKIDSGNATLIEFRESVRRSSVLLTDALRRAELAHNAGDLESAKSAVEEALSVDPYNTTAKALNAILSKEITERSKRKQIEDLVAGARKEIALRHFTSALELLGGAEELDPSAAEVQQLIRSATAGREHEKRRQAFEKACREIEDLLNRDEYSVACTKADEALQSFPQDLGLLKLKGFAEKQREAWSRRQFIDTQIAAARHFADSGELLRAQRILNEALERYPDDSGVLSLLEIVTDGIARQEAQRREAERLVNERRRYIRVQLEAAAELQRASQTADALKKIREGLVQYPDSDELKSRASVLEEALAKEEAQRRRAEEEAQRKRAEIEKTIAESWQFLSNKQTGEAVAHLDQALRRHPDSADLKSQLEFAQRRLAVAQAERERAEQEARRRASAIQKEVAAARRLLDSRQTDQAVAALQEAVEHYSDSEELNSLLQVAQRRLATERELAERESRQKHAEIETEIVAARELLESKRTSESVARLEQALRRYPDSEELKVPLAYARQRLAAEEAARERAEEEERRRRAWVDAEISATRQWLDGKQADRAVISLQQALTQYPNNEQLKTQLDFAKRRLAQEQSEREQAEQAARRMQAEIDREITLGWELLDANKTNQAVAGLEKALQRFPDSRELRSQFELARNRFAAEEAERQRIAEEQRRKLADIHREIVSARQFMELKQTNQAVAALELAFQRFPDSRELKTELEVARERLAAEEAEKQRAAQEARRRQEEIKKEMLAATRLLDSGQTAPAVASLEASVRRVPDSEDLKLQLQRARKRFAEEEAERQRIAAEQRRRLEEIQREITAARQFLDAKQTQRAVATLELAFQRFPDSAELKSQLDSTRQRLQAEEVERERIAQEARRRQEEIKKEMAKSTALLDSQQTAAAVESLEASLRRIPDSDELKLQLQRAKERLAEEEASKRRSEEEKRRRQVAIANALATSKKQLDSRQTAGAVAMLELALRSYPESEELKSQLDTARGRLAAEQAERERAEREALRRRNDIDREIAAARKQLDSKQTSAAATALEGAVRAFPESSELKNLLETARQRLALELQEKLRAEEERKRRQAEIAAQIAAARTSLESKQTSKAVSALELAARKFPESEELRSMLAAGQKTLAEERAAEEKAAQEALARRQKIAAEVESARQLLKANQTAKAVAKLEEAVGRYPEGEELRSQLAVGKEQLAREIAEREKSERRQAQIQSEKAKVKVLLDANQPEEAAETIEAALRDLGKDAKLQELLADAKAALKRKKAEEKRRAAERQQAEEKERQRDRDLADLRKLADSVAGAKRTALEKSLRKAQEIASRYPKDGGIQQILSETEAAIQSTRTAEQQSESTETRFATRLFTPAQPADGNAIPTPVPVQARETSEIPSAGILPRLLNKWTVIAALSLIVIGIGVKYLVSSKGTVTTHVVNGDKQPPGAEEQRQALDEADKLVASGDLEGAIKELKQAGALRGPLRSEIQKKRASIEAATKDVSLRKLRQQEEGLWQSAKADSDAGRFQGAQVSLNKILALPSGGTRRGEARDYLDHVLPRRQREEALFAQAKQSAFSKDLPTLAATESSLDSVIQMNGPRKAEAALLRRTVEGEIEGAKKLQQDQLLADLQNAARQDIARGDLASARQKIDQIKTAGGNSDTLLAEIEHAQAEKAKSTQYENSFQEAVQQYQQAVASNDRSALERARSSFRTLAQQEGAHAHDAQKYAREIESKIVALNQPPMYSASQPAAPPRKLDQPVQNSTDQSAHVRDVIKHYEQAFADRNADELRQIWPDMGDKYASYKKIFEAASAQHMEVTIQSMKISDDTEQATVTASTITSYTPRGGKMQRHPDRALFELLRQNGTWVIKDVR